MKGPRSIKVAARGFLRAAGCDADRERGIASEIAQLVAREIQCTVGKFSVGKDHYMASMVPFPEERACDDGGVCEFEPDYEYDESGNTINCAKCGEPPDSPYYEAKAIPDWRGAAASSKRA